MAKNILKGSIANQAILEIEYDKKIFNQKGWIEEKSKLRTDGTQKSRTLDLNSNIVIVTLNANDLNVIIKGRRLSF